MHTNTITRFYEFLVVNGCISFNMHFPQTLIIKITKCLIFIFSRDAVKAVPDDISVKTLPI